MKIVMQLIKAIWLYFLLMVAASWMQVYCTKRRELVVMQLLKVSADAYNSFDYKVKLADD
jgi:hypothetical protein